MKEKELHIAVIGLGYVGLPLAVEFARRYQVLGYDIDVERIAELNRGVDHTLEMEEPALRAVLHPELAGTGLSLSSEASSISHCNVFIVTVPTPIDSLKCPDLSALLSASCTVGKYLKKGDIIIYESTVYPGCTEEDCVPALEQSSGLQYNKDFFCGYSPERINPGDKVHTLVNIQKVTSGSTPEVAEFINNLYASVVKAGTHKAPSIRVAEASKAIENAQRDLNISFVNELAFIFDRMGIDTSDVLEAAGTKWNFLKFKPGLVGGHCIGVDPYYLVHKSQELGYNPQVILSGRNVNDSMGAFIAGKVVKLMIAHDIKIKDSKALILGITFKENCPDIRNTKVVDVYRELISFGLEVDVYDPWASPVEVKNEYGIELKKEILPDDYKAIIVAVAHHEFLQFDFAAYKAKGCVIFDTKSLVDRKWVDARL